MNLKERIYSYEQNYDIKLVNKLPIFIVLNGRGFRKTTAHLEKPFSSYFAEAMCATMLSLASEIDGSTLLYSFNDEIVILLRNDQHNEITPWCDNRIQKIVSSAGSIATLQFNKQILANDINVVGDPIFTAETFIVPSISEAVNVFISKQQKAFYISIYMAVFHELIKTRNLKDVQEIISNKSLEEKLDILKTECKKDYNLYSLAFRRGMACYRKPKVFQNENGETIKNKLVINTSLPIFAKEQDFLYEIINSEF